MLRNLRAILGSSRFLVQLAAAFHWLWTVPLGPIRSVLVGSVGWLFRRYRTLWMSWTHDKYGGFVYWRGGAMALGTVAFLYILPSLVLFGIQSALFFTTRSYERVYLIQSDEIYPDDNIWAVRGCDKLPCDQESSIYYRISPTLFNHLWSVVNNGWIFIPDNVGSGVPTGLTQCWVRSYGIRFKTLMRRLDIYPNALEISCDGPAR